MGKCTWTLQYMKVHIEAALPPSDLVLAQLQSIIFNTSHKSPEASGFASMGQLTKDEVLAAFAGVYVDTLAKIITVSLALSHCLLVAARR